MFLSDYPNNSNFKNYSQFKLKENFNLNLNLINDLNKQTQINDIISYVVTPQDILRLFINNDNISQQEDADISDSFIFYKSNSNNISEIDFEVINLEEDKNNDMYNKGVGYGKN